MLAEKFILVLEARIRRDQYQNDSQRVHERPVALNSAGPQSKQDADRHNRGRKLKLTKLKLTWTQKAPLKA